MNTQNRLIQPLIDSLNRGLITIPDVVNMTNLTDSDKALIINRFNNMCEVKSGNLIHFKDVNDFKLPIEYESK